MNVISDKQMLKRCIKQIVRNAAAVETQAGSFLEDGPWGLDALTQRQKNALFARKRLGRNLLQEDEVGIISAFDALGFGDCSEDAIRQGVSSYDRNAWFREILDMARLSSVLVPVTLKNALEIKIKMTDNRLQPELVIDDDFFHPGRYGIDFKSCAEQICSSARAAGIRYLKMDGWTEEELRYCILPVCEDEKLILFLQTENAEQLRCFFKLYEQFGYFHAIVDVDEQIESAVLPEFSDKDRVLLRLKNPGNTGAALRKLGLHFIPFTSRAVSAEEMLGGWIQARERLWPELVEAYLPMAKAGCELTDEMLEEDISYWLGGNVRQWESDFEND